jgi:hypothetical protein
LVHSTPFAFFISWVGMLFDLAVGFLLLGRRTRMLGLVLMTLFHTTNHFLIFNDIAWFPLVGITTSWIFLGPDWPSTLKRWIRSPHFRGPDLKWFIPGVLLLPGVGGFLGWKVRASIRTLSEGMASSRVLVLVLAWMGFQIVFPLRCHLIAGDERFTWEGLSFAWRLKADTRHAYVPTMTVEDPAVIERKQTRESTGHPLGSLEGRSEAASDRGPQAAGLEFAVRVDRGSGRHHRRTGAVQPAVLCISRNHTRGSGAAGTRTLDFAAWPSAGGAVFLRIA